MKNIFLTLSIIATLIITSCSNDDNITNEQFKKEAAVDIILTTQEIEDLLFLREEEKLARDVYLFSFEKYNLQIFKNISNSEAQHMSSVLNLLNKYNIDDPVSSEIGIFNNVELQNIYNILIEQSRISLLDAFKAGNKIEDLDIKDLSLNETRTDKLDLLIVYANLKCGSRNHLRNFNIQVLQNEGFYIPEFISQEDFDGIITTSNEKCNSN